jgi:hypothetical protein
MSKGGTVPSDIQAKVHWSSGEPIHGDYRKTHMEYKKAQLKRGLSFPLQSNRSDHIGCLGKS